MTSQNRCECKWACTTKWKDEKRNVWTSKRQTQKRRKKILTHTLSKNNILFATCSSFYFIHFIFISVALQVVALSCHCLVSIWISIKTHVIFLGNTLHIYLYKSCFITSNISSSFGNFLFTWAFQQFSLHLLQTLRPFAFSDLTFSLPLNINVFCCLCALLFGQKSENFVIFFRKKNKQMLDFGRDFHGAMIIIIIQNGLKIFAK